MRAEFFRKSAPVGSFDTTTRAIRSSSARTDERRAATEDRWEELDSAPRAEDPMAFLT